MRGAEPVTAGGAAEVQLSATARNASSSLRSISARVPAHCVVLLHSGSTTLLLINDRPTAILGGTGLREWSPSMSQARDLDGTVALVVGGSRNAAERGRLGYPQDIARRWQR